MAYLWVKWIHILSSTLLFGTGLGIAFFMWAAHRRGDAAHIAATARTVVIADACFTAPAVAVQLASGLWLANALGNPYAAALAAWRTGAVRDRRRVLAAGTVVAVARARSRAEAAALAGAPLPAAYHRVMRWWFWLGWPAFLGVLAIFWLMVAKPV